MPCLLYACPPRPGSVFHSLGMATSPCSTMARAEGWIHEKASTALHPTQVETALASLNQNWPETAPSFVEVIEGFPLGQAALLHLLSVSSICASRLMQDPHLLLWLGQPEVCLAPRDRVQMSHDLHVIAGDSIAAKNFRALRVWKSHEMVRIALREVADVAPLEPEPRRTSDA